jgi:hypothetical protein
MQKYVTLSVKTGKRIQNTRCETGKLYLSEKSYIILSAQPVCTNREGIQRPTVVRIPAVLFVYASVSMCKQHVKCKHH